VDAPLTVDEINDCFKCSVFTIAETDGQFKADARLNNI
jgi:hypothetical protein